MFDHGALVPHAFSKDKPLEDPMPQLSLHSVIHPLPWLPARPDYAANGSRHHTGSHRGASTGDLTNPCRHSASPNRKDHREIDAPKYLKNLTDLSGIRGHI